MPDLGRAELGERRVGVEDAQVPVEDGGGRRRVGEDRVEQLTELDALLGGQLLLADEPGVLDEQRGLERHPLDHPQAFPVEAPVVRDDEHDRAQRNAAGQERHDGERLEAEPLPDGARLLGRGDEVDQVLAQALVDLRPAAREQLGHLGAVRRGERLGLPQLLDEVGTRRIPVRRRDPADAAVRFTQPHRSPVGDGRHDPVEHEGEGAVRFSLRGEHPRHVGQEIGQLRVECVRPVRSPYGPVIHGLNLLANTVGESSGGGHGPEGGALRGRRTRRDRHARPAGPPQRVDRPHAHRVPLVPRHVPRPIPPCGPSSSPAPAAGSAPAPTPRPSTDTCRPAATTRARRDELARPGYGVRAEYDHAFAFHYGMRLPVIAAVNGPAAGVGLVLACYCDVRFAAEGAKLTTSAGRLGLPAEYGLSWVLPRLVGVGHAADLLISSRVVEAEEAARMGLVNRVLPQAELLPAALSLRARTSPRRSRRRRPGPPRRSSTPTSTATWASRWRAPRRCSSRWCRGPTSPRASPRGATGGCPSGPATGPDERAKRANQ